MKKSIFLVIFSLLISITVTAQVLFNGKAAAVDNLTGTWLLTVPQSAFGSDYTASVTLGTSVSSCTINGVTVKGSYTFHNVQPGATYRLQQVSGNDTVKANIQFTHWPVIQISGNFAKTPYRTATVTITHPDSTAQESISSRVRWAGSSTAGPYREKRNFHLKFYNSDGTKMEKTFFGLRSDFHWRLDAGQIDFARVRNRVAKDIWASFASAPYYASIEPKTARNYVRGDFVEVFLNDEYMGIYSLNEHMDRQQLKLKQYDYENGVFHGGLWKPMKWSYVTTFNRLPAVINATQKSWDEFVVKYPNIDDVNPTNYKPLWNAIKFTLNATDKVFSDSAQYYFDIPVFRDYYLFTIMLQAPDNIGKNLYYACYDVQTDKRLTIGIWDLDCTQGQYWSNSGGWYHYQDVGPEVDFRSSKFLGGHRAFWRLWNCIPAFHGLATERYWELRSTTFNPDSIAARYEAYFNEMKSCGADQREIRRWSGGADLEKPMDFDAELDYLRDWWKRHIAYLDTKVFIPYPVGDVNFDRTVDINDVIGIIDYLLGSSQETINHYKADYNHSGTIDTDDISRLIDQLLDN